MIRNRQAGFTLIELMVSLVITVLLAAGLATMMVESSKVNRSQQMTARVQASARNCLSMVVQRLRSAGWDPLNAGLDTLNMDSDTSDGIAEIELFADLDADGANDGLDEQVLIRHVGNRIVWRRTNDVSDPFIVLATNITNDADGDGTVEEMFVASPPADPKFITVRITAQSPIPDPVSGEFIRYTVSSDVVIRKSI
jgi:prepilin-type N-terminal cleavage/methylation domain-containing protein